MSRYDILELVPIQVIVGKEPKSLEQWNTSVVYSYCINTLFKEIWKDSTLDAVRKITRRVDSTPNPDWEKVR